MQFPSRMKTRASAVLRRCVLALALLGTVLHATVLAGHANWRLARATPEALLLADLGVRCHPGAGQEAGNGQEAPQETPGRLPGTPDAPSPVCPICQAASSVQPIVLAEYELERPQLSLRPIAFLAGSAGSRTAFDITPRSRGPPRIV